MKCWHFFIVQAAPSISPSTGEYLDSAPVVNLLPANTTICPSSQQRVVSTVQLQVFWSSRKPIPVLLQSVCKQVCLFISKVLIPCSTFLIISPLLSSNAFCNSVVHSNTADSFNNGLNGSIGPVLEKAYEHCSTNPNQLRIPVTSVGVEKSLIASRKAAVGLTVSPSNWKPRNYTFLLQTWNFFLENRIPAPEQILRYLHVCMKQPSMVSLHRTVSLMHLS